MNLEAMSDILSESFSWIPIYEWTFFTETVKDYTTIIYYLNNYGQLSPVKNNKKDPSIYFTQISNHLLSLLCKN